MVDVGADDEHALGWGLADLQAAQHVAIHAGGAAQANVCRELDLTEDCVHRLFGGPVEAWKIAGLPDPGEEARAYMLNLEPPAG
jgi:hypothetical protein